MCINQAMHNIFLILALLLTPLVIHAEPKGQPLNEDPLPSVLTIASSNNFPPINLLDDNGELQGFARDISSAVAKQIGVKVRRKHSPRWTDVLSWLDSGEADLIHDTGYTKKREEFLDFSLPIIEMSEVIFVKQNQYDIHSIDSLKGKKVACVNKHITHLFLQGIPEINCHIVNTPAEGLAALISGSTDAFVYPEQIVQYLVQDLGLTDEIKITGSPLHSLSWSMTVKKGNQKLLEQLNIGIKAIKRSGEYDEIYNKWFGRKFLSGYTQKELLPLLIFSGIIFILLGLMIGLAIYARKMRKTYRDLVESEYKYHQLIDKLPQRIFLKDLQLNYVSCNKKYADDLGISPNEIHGKNDFEFHPENAEEYQQGDRDVMAADESIDFVEHYIDAGKKHTIHTTKIPMHDDKGEVNGILGVFSDITEQQELQFKISAMLHEHTTITDSVPNVLYKLDMEGNIVWCNKQFEKVTGLEQDQIIGQSALLHFPDRDKDAIIEAISSVFKNGFARVEAHFITHLGEVPYNFNGATLLDDKGKVVGLTGVGSDISKEKEAEIQRENLQQQLQQAQKMEAIGQLTGGIAHDFNNMLASILGYSQLALKQQENNSDNKTVGYLQEVISAGERASKLIRQMLTFSRGTEGEMKPLLLKTQLDDTVNMLRPILPSSVELRLEVDDVPAIMGDSVQLQQMLTNLCINARDAMDGQGNLTLKLEKLLNYSITCSSCHKSITSDFVVISVQDSGHGIPNDIINKIFDPFISSKDVGKGTGMGLAMVHGIVHEHNAHITVQSDPETGTVFSVYFPYLDTTPLLKESSQTINSELTSTHQTDSYHILIVDDEPAVMSMLTEMMKSEGYEVTGVTDSSEALALFTNTPERFDLVVTDQTMPGITGVEMAQAMLIQRSDVPIILCSGYSEQIDKNGAEKLGICEFLSKPLDMNRFMALIEKNLKGKAP